MKKLMSAVTAFGLVALIFSGCQKLVVPVQTSSNTMSAVIDSNVFTATGGSVAAYLSGTQLVFKGVTPQNVTITVTLQTFNGYTSTTVLDNYACYATIDSGVGPVQNMMNSGVLSITQTYPTFEGTFYFKCVDSTVVSHGRFSIKTPTN